MKRKQQSGAQKRKSAKEKLQKREESLKKVPKISDMFRANVVEPSSSTQASSTENMREENVSSRSEAAVAPAPSGQNIENENTESENDSGDLSDETIDFEDEHDNFDELFLNVSSSSRHCDIETQSASEKSSERGADRRFPTDVALWDLVADISALQRYWTKLGRVFHVLRLTTDEAIFDCCQFSIYSFRSGKMSKFLR